MPAFVFASAFSLFAQRYTSPPQTSSVTIHGKQIKIDYYSPAMHGRKIMGDLVPYGKVWATGANVVTSITSEAPLQFGTLKLAKGAYGIWTMPGEKEWTIIVSNETGTFHLSHDSSHDIGKFTVTPKAIAETVEALAINPVSLGGDKGAVVIRWENTEVSVPFAVLP
jgi:hypothetical protein